MISLPTRQRRAEDGQIPPLSSPKQSRVYPRTKIKEAEPGYVGFTTDLATGEQVFTYKTDTGTVRMDQHGWISSSKTESRYFIHPDEPNSARIDMSCTETYGREGQLDVRVFAHQIVTSDETHFIIDAEIEVYEADKKIFNREWHERIVRDGV